MVVLVWKALRMTDKRTTAWWWGARAFSTGETNPYDAETPEHREFVQGRMDAREAAIEAVIWEQKNVA